MTDTFVTPDTAALMLGLESTTAMQQLQLAQLCVWADEIIVNNIGDDPRRNPDYEGDTFGGLEYVALMLVIVEFKKIQAQSHGLKSGTFGTVSVTYSNAPIISPLMVSMLQRYRRYGIGA